MIDKDLLPYWPRQQDVNDCITSEAEAASEWVALAVHQPMRFVPRVIGSTAPPVGDCDEQALLSAFLTDDLPEGRVIIPIVGESGVGKSHVIRWLDMQLRVRGDADRRVVIRIPKGVSLREVLRLIVERLPPARYGHYRDELERAQHELDSREASGLLCEMLAHVLEEMGRDARDRRRLRPDDAEAKERDAYCSVLPALLRNQYLRDHHFLTSRSGTDGPVRRLVEHLTTARSPAMDDDRKHGFVAEDLDFGDLGGDDALGRPERQAITSLRVDRRPNAARILNLAIDDAKQRLLRIGPSTISDLFDNIRRDLLTDGKELVLLVEDFVVLSGLQKQLLQVIIKEAVRDGTQVLCTMRTALAYTSGYLDADTVLTRAHVEYRIPDDSANDEEIFVRVERLVGAYLNAARIGQQTLEVAYRAREAGSEPRSWIPRFAAPLETEARAMVEAFETSPDAYELFPFNRNALRQLAREGCVRNGNFVYNPRFVIQNVLNAVLVHRALFEVGRFPPGSFGSRGTQVGATVTDHVGRTVADEDRDRHLRFLAYWAGGGGAGHVAPRVVEAFQLRVEAIPGARGDRIASRPTSELSPSSGRAPPPEAKSLSPLQPEGLLSPGEVRWDGVLEEWRRGSTLAQRDADQIRRLVFDAARASIDWDWYLHRPRVWAEKWADKQRERLHLPRAAGGAGRSSGEAAASICTEEDLQSELDSARVKLALMGLVRLNDVHKENRSYEGVERDLAAAGPLVERVATALRRHIRDSYIGVTWDPGPLLVEGLLVGARALGVEGAQRDDRAVLSNALFEPAPANAPRGISEKSTWAEYGAALARCRGAEGAGEASWIDYLLDLIGARQGGAGKVHAIDAGCLKVLIDDAAKHWSHASQPPRSVVAGADGLEKLRATHYELRRFGVSVDAEREAFVAWRNQCLDWMGAEFDKNEVLRLMKEAADAAHDAGLGRVVNLRSFNASVEAFRTAAVKTALEDVAKLGAGDSGAALALLGRGYAPIVQATNALVAAYDALEEAIMSEIASAQRTTGADPLAEALAALRAALSEAERSLGVLDGHDN